MNLQRANNPEFVYPFAAMSQQQLRALRRASRRLPDAMACEYDVDVYVLKIEQDHFEVDHALLIFAAACVLAKGLSQTKARVRGFCCTSLSQNRELMANNANAILFQIVNACSMRPGSLRTAMQLLAITVVI